VCIESLAKTRLASAPDAREPCNGCAGRSDRTRKPIDRSTLPGNAQRLYGLDGKRHGYPSRPGRCVQPLGNITERSRPADQGEFDQLNTTKGCLHEQDRRRHHLQWSIPACAPGELCGHCPSRIGPSQAQAFQVKRLSPPAVGTFPRYQTSKPRTVLLLPRGRRQPPRDTYWLRWPKAQRPASRVAINRHQKAEQGHPSPRCWFTQACRPPAKKRQMDWFPTQPQ